MREHEVDQQHSSGTEYMHVHVCTQLFTNIIIYHIIYYNLWAGQCRVQSQVQVDPNNQVGGIIRQGLICTQPLSYVKKTINLYAYVQLS